LIIVQTIILGILWYLSRKSLFGIVSAIKYLAGIWIILLIFHILWDRSFILWMNTFGILLPLVYIIIFITLFLNTLYQNISGKISTTKPWLNSIVYGLTLTAFCFSTAYMYKYPATISCIQWRVKKSNQDLDMITKALDTYYVDNNSYPPGDLCKTRYPSKENTFQIPIILTTPIAYLDNLPHDPCNHNGDNLYEYGCGTTKKGNWYYIVTAYGNDVISNIDEQKYNPDIPEWAKDSIQSSGLTFDPTNGITSLGDFWRISK
jgi:hypothetical protein